MPQLPHERPFRKDKRADLKNATFPHLFFSFSSFWVRFAWFRISWLLGFYAWICCNFMGCCMGLLCLLGVPATFRRDAWDVEHFCFKCNRKLGYNVICKGCMCCVSQALQMPQDGIQWWYGSIGNRTETMIMTLLQKQRLESRHNYISSGDV